MKTLTVEQIQAIESPQSLAVIASAGTGKTTVLTERFVHCHVTRDVPLNRILAFTYTEKAAREMKERILQSPHLPLTSLPFLKVSTIHAFCARLLKQHGHHIGVDADFEVLDETASAVITRGAIRAHLRERLEAQDTLYTQAYARLGYKILHDLFWQLATLDLLSLPQNARGLHPQTADTELFAPLLAEVERWQKCEHQKRVAQKTLTFADLEVLSLELLQKKPDLNQRLSQLYRHILVDEFQDVSQNQFALIEKLFAPGVNTLFIVGDPKQSIYRFRGADVSLFFAMQDIIAKHGGATITLKHSFRTPAKLQTAFNALFPPLLDPLHPGLFTPGIAPHDEAEARFCKIELDDGDDTDEEDESTPAESGALIAVVQNLLSTGVSPNEIAVLANTRTHFVKLRQALQSRNIPAVCEEKTDILDDPHVSLLVKILQLLNKPDDPTALAGLMQSFACNHNSDTIRAVLAHPDTAWVSNALAPLAPRFAEWNKLKDTLPLTTLCETILTDWRDVFAGASLAALDMFLQTLASWHKQGLLFVRDADSALEILQDEGLLMPNPGSQQNSIKLYTIHGAKGLEFKHVLLWRGSKGRGGREIYLSDRAQGLLFKSPLEPQEAALDFGLKKNDPAFAEFKDEHKTAERAELMRLVYVALTRTQKCLYVFVPRPSQKLAKHLAKNPHSTDELKSYNDVLSWLAVQPQLEPFVPGAAAPPSTITNSPAANHISVIQTIPPESLSLWTVTELETLYDCPRLYDFRYQKGWLIPQERASHGRKIESFAGLRGASKGNFLHEVLQFYVPTRDNLSEVVEQALFNQHLQIDLKDAVTQTRALIAQLQAAPALWNRLYAGDAVLNEVGFTHRLKSFILTGKIDRLVQHDSQWALVDYKTHAIRNPNDKKILSDRFAFQLQCYALAVAERYNQNEVHATLLFTSTTEHTSFLWGCDELKQFARKLEDLHAHWQKRSFAELDYARTAALCADCAYRGKTCAPPG